MLKQYSALLLASLLLSGCTTTNGPSTVNAMPSVATLSVNGPYEIRGYSSFPDVPEFGDATIYYPIDAEVPVAGVAISPGFTHHQRHVNWWGPRLASHGYAVLVLDTNNPRDQPPLRADALMAAVGILRGENSRSGSPLNGKIDISKMAIMGHSMGGGGTLLAANANSDQIKAAIPLNSWLPDADFSQVTVPTLFITGEADTIAPVADHAWKHFQSIPSTTTTVYMEIAGGDHFIVNSGRGPDLPTLGRYVIAWLKLYVDEDEHYREFIYGSVPVAERAKFSRYITNP
ncbi:MAG: alpha/beta hydrolase [Pseudohongiellaceae bacterium]